MKQISAILNQLDTCLTGDMPDEPGVRQLSFRLDNTPETSLLEWLAAQINYPKFYWQQRDEQYEAALCGNACSFDNMALAQDFIARHAEYSDLRVWGLNTFSNAKQAQDNAFTPANALFLPRIEISRQRDEYWLRCNLVSSYSLQQEASRTRTFIAELVASRRLPDLNVRVLQQQHLPTQEQWEQLISLALQGIEQQQFEKVVLARKTTLNLNQPLNAAAFLAASRAVNRHCYHFMFAFTPDQAFLGSSPERLFLRESNQLYTEALAGTVANVDDNLQAEHLANWLLTDNKNQRENLLVVDDICQRLQDQVKGVDVMPVEVLRLRKVQHLRRSIYAELKRQDDSACLHYLQPTAAVAGLPRQAAHQFIQQNELFNRQWYAGSAGYLSFNRSEFAVALRSAAVKGNKLELFAGAGIVAGSDARQEWQEIENKVAGLRTLLDDDFCPSVKAG